MLFNYALTSLVLSAVAYASPINLDFAGQVNTDATGTDAISSANTASANASANATDTANTVGTGATSALPLGVSVNGVGTTAEQLETLQHTGENLRASLAALNISEADIDEIVPAILRLDVDGSGPSQFFRMSIDIPGCLPLTLILQWTIFPVLQPPMCLALLELLIRMVLLFIL